MDHTILQEFWKMLHFYSSGGYQNKRGRKSTKSNIIKNLKKDNFPVPKPKKLGSFDSLESMNMEFINYNFATPKKNFDSDRTISTKSCSETTSLSEESFTDNSSEISENMNRYRVLKPISQTCYEYDPEACLLERIASFKKKMQSRCKKDLITKFTFLTEKFTNLILIEGGIFKSSKANLFAECLLMIISNFCGMSKQLYCDCLKVETNSESLSCKIRRIKNSNCYKKLDKMFENEIADNSL